MKITVLPLVAVGVLAWGVAAGLAQEILPNPEKIPGKKQEAVPPPPPPVAGPIEGHPRPCCPVPKVLVYERDEPVHILADREEVRFEKVPTLAIGFRDEKRVVVNMEMRAREVSRIVCYTTLEPCPVTDPCTGQCTTVLKQVERTRIQKDVEYVAVPVEQVVVVQVPVLQPAEEEVEHRTVILEWQTVMQKRAYALSIPSEAPSLRHVVTPPPPAACPIEPH
jgi:hypothetical protein